MKDLPNISELGQKATLKYTHILNFKSAACYKFRVFLHKLVWLLRVLMANKQYVFSNLHFSNLSFQMTHLITASSAILKGLRMTYISFCRHLLIISLPINVPFHELFQSLILRYAFQLSRLFPDFLSLFSSCLLQYSNFKL